MSSVSTRSDHPASASSPTNRHALAAGFRLAEFEVLRVLGVGGFGIVYLARDHALQRNVALKEYMPASLAARGAAARVTIRSPSFAQAYAFGLDAFVNEARLLARFDHPSLVKVQRFWEDNGTAYMAMPYLQGVTLADVRRAMSSPPDEAWLRRIVDAILSALEFLHREGIYHRDVAPENILLPSDGPPVLLDFGAARHAIGNTQSFTTMLRLDYAPIEQFVGVKPLHQGPWTDLYALGAVMHFLIFGMPPAPATERAVEGDDAGALADRRPAGISPRLLEAVAWALEVRPNQRPQSAKELRDALDGRIAAPAVARRRLAPAAGSAPAPTSPPPSPRVSSAPAAPRVRVAPTVVMALLGLVVVGVVAWRADSPRDPGVAWAPATPARIVGVAAPAAPRPAAPIDTTMRESAPSPVVAAALPAATEPPLVSTRAKPVRVAHRASTSTRAIPRNASSVRSHARLASSTHRAGPRARKLAKAPAKRSAPLMASAATAPKPDSAVTADLYVVTSNAYVERSADSPIPGLRGRGRLSPARSEPSHGSSVGEAPGSWSAYAAPEPASAREACSGRGFFARTVCMDRECEQPRFRDSAECSRILAMKREREGR